MDYPLTRSGDAFQFISLKLVRRLSVRTSHSLGLECQSYHVVTKLRVLLACFRTGVYAVSPEEMIVFYAVLAGSALMKHGSLLVSSFVVFLPGTSRGTLVSYC
jgi:hypothetical protein